MKVVLLKDVRDIGRAHTVIEVSDGHALNFLIPHKLAVRAGTGALNIAQSKVKQVVERRELDTKLVSERLTALAEEKVTIVKKANDQGHLYDGVGAEEIAEAAQLPEFAIKLPKPLKEVGDHEVSVAVGENFGKITVSIVAE